MGPLKGLVFHHGPMTNPAFSVLPSANVNVMFPCRYLDEPDAGHTAVASACNDLNVWFFSGADNGTTCAFVRTVSNAVLLWNGGSANCGRRSAQGAQIHEMTVQWLTSIPLYTNDGPEGKYSAGYARPLPSKSANESFVPVEAALALKNGPRSSCTPAPCVCVASVTATLMDANNVSTNDKTPHCIDRGKGIA